MDEGMVKDQNRNAHTQDGPYRATVLEPVGKLANYFNNVNAAIDKRNHKMIDYDSTRSKVRKMVEKPSDDTGKLPRAQQEHDEAREIYELLNEQLITELPQLVELRIRECELLKGDSIRRAGPSLNTTDVLVPDSFQGRSACVDGEAGPASWIDYLA